MAKHNRASAMTADHFREWRGWMGWSAKRAAEELGIGHRTAQNYDLGEWPVPRAIELACEALALGRRGYERRMRESEKLREPRE